MKIPFSYDTVRLGLVARLMLHMPMNHNGGLPMRLLVKSIFVPLLTLSAIAFAQDGDLKPADSKAASSSAQTSMHMTSVAPLFIENETFSSAVHLVNEAQSGGWMDITVFDLDGNQVASVPEYFEPVSERTFQVKDLLRSSGVIVAAGSLQFMEAPAAKPIAVLGQVSITHYQAGTYAYLDEEFSMPQYGASNVLRAVAEGSRAYTVIALTNTTPKPLSSSVTCTGSSAAQVTQGIVLRPFQTRLLRPCAQGVRSNDVQLADLEAIPSGDDNTKQNEALGISVNTVGTPGDLVAYGLVSRSAQGGLDLGSIEFIDPAPLRSPGLVFTGVPIGYTALLNKTYDGHVAVVNFTNKPAHVSVLFAKNKNDASGTTVNQLTLPPASSKLLKLTGLEGDVNMLNSFIIRSDVEPGGVLSKVVSRVLGSSYRAETPAKDENQINNSGGHPWTVANGITSTLFLFNHDSKAQTVTVRIGTKKGDWRKAYPIRPMQTLSIDIGSLGRVNTTSI